MQECYDIQRKLSSEVIKQRFKLSFSEFSIVDNLILNCLKSKFANELKLIIEDTD